MGTRVATFPGCAVITHWLPHTPVQIFFRLLLVHKTICSSSSIQTGILALTFRITLLYMIFLNYLGNLTFRDRNIQIKVKISDFAQHNIHYLCFLKKIKIKLCKK